MDKKQFGTFLESINKCYAKEVIGELPKLSDFPNDIFKIDNVSLTRLEEILGSFNNLFLKSVSLRLIAIKQLQECRNNESMPDLKRIWKLIFQSIMILPSHAIVSSIGSQGFLSIPLYKYDSEREKLDFFRLHIWDNSLNGYINTVTRDNFSIHTHSFFAESWILCGEVINERYSVRTSRSSTDYSIFNIEYNQTLNEINQHTSTARNSNQFMECRQISREHYFRGGNYVMKAGEYHKSGFAGKDNGLSATLFNFYAAKGRVDNSFVIGPSSIESSKINRKMNIDPKGLIKRIDEDIKQND